MGIIFYRCSNGRYKTLANSHPKPEPAKLATPDVANANGDSNGHVMISLPALREPIRIPEDGGRRLNRHCMSPWKRNGGQKPRYKETRRGQGRATQNYML